MSKAPNWMVVPNYVDQHVSKFCENKYTDDKENHCAHFVSHALALSYGYTCKKQTGGKFDAATIRVHDLFANCEEVGRWDDKKATLTDCLVFITHSGNVNVKQKTMVNHPRKHVGVFTGGSVIHYSNKSDRVVRQPLDTFKGHYPPPYNGLFFGTLSSIK